MAVTISNDLLKTSSLSEEGLLLEIFISLFERKVLLLGKAAALAYLFRIQIQKELVTREISIPYSELRFDTTHVG